MNSLITPALMLEIQERAAIGQSLRQIQEWLANQGIKYSHVSISRVIKKQRKQRETLSQEILRPLLEKQLTNDLDILAAMIEECQTTIKLAKAKGDERLKLHAMDRMDKFLRMSFKVKGIETEDDANTAVDADYNEVLTRFDWKVKEDSTDNKD